MLETLIPVVTFLTQFLSEKLLVWGLDRIHLAKVKEKLDLKIQLVLQESIMNFPDEKYVIENFDLVGYFQNLTVQRELSLLIRPSDNQEPDLKVLQDIWRSKLGDQLPGNYQLILERFLRSLKQRIWEIEEIQPLLHYKETKVFQKDVRSQLQILISSLPSDDKNLNDDIQFLDYKSHQVLAGINNQLSNGVEIDRKTLDDEFDKKFDKSRLIIIKGDAGAGKSAFVKRTILRLQCSPYIVLAFKADIFSKDSLDELFPSLNNSFSKVLEHLCQQQKVIIVIDSLEKLLEVYDYDSFKELLRVCKNFANIKIILTCRSFAYAQLLFDLHPNLFQYDFLEIPHLGEAELGQVEKQFPLLAALFKKKSLRHLLRKPFYLNLLVTHSEITNNADFISEKDFRNLVWQKVITKGDLRRSETFRAIAIRRAISMSLFTKIEDPNPDIIKELIADGIILTDEKLGELYCPSHDIFEDIALIRYVEQIYQDDSEVLEFFAKLDGKEPAIRRAFRLWLNDQLYDASSTFSDFISRVLGDSRIDQYWKDETIIAILSSNYSKNYFNSNTDVLKTNHWVLFTRFIHLLRTSCQEPDEQLSQQLETDNKKGNNYWLYLKPVGPGWETVIDFIHNNIGQLRDHHNLVFQLIVKDWSKLLKIGVDFPPESVSAGRILLSILDDVKNEHDSRKKFYLSEKDIDDGIVVLFMLCSLFPVEIRELIQAASSCDLLSSDDKPNYQLRDFYNSIVEHVLSGIHSNIVCKELPDLVYEVAMKTWLKQEDEWRQLGGIDDIGDSFGLDHGIDHDYFPSGIYQTPIRFLLYYHPAKALRLIVSVMNYITDAYASSKRGKENGVVRIEMHDENGSTVYQSGDAVLWGMYRGLVQSTPYLLQSILMALENWLLELCQIEQDWADKLIKSTYSYFFRNSVSVATTAVLASVAMAYPEKIGKACFPILKVKEFYKWDILRLTGDQFPLSPFDQEIPFAQEERYRSNQLPHRKYRLEILATKFQVSGYWNEINAILDNFHALVKPDENSWKLALNQMDFRKYKADETAGIQNQNQVLYRPQIDEDLADFVGENQSDIERINKIAGIGSWSRKVFDGNSDVDNSFERWRELRKEILELEGLDDEHVRLYADPPYFAAIGIRDFASDMTEEEKLWCIITVIEVIQEQVVRNVRNEYFSPMKFSPLSITPSVSSVPLILLMDISKDIKTTAKTIIFLALIQLRDPDSKTLFETFRSSLWRIDPGFAKACFAGMLKYAKMLRRRKISYLPSEGSDKNEEKFYKAVLRLADSISREIIRTDIPNLSFHTHSHWYLGFAAQIIPFETKDELYRSYLETLFMLIFQILNIGRDNQQYSSDYIGTESLLQDYLAKYLLHQDSSYAQKFFSSILDQVFDATGTIEYRAKEFIEKIIEHPLKNKKQYFQNLIITLGQYDIKSVIRLLSGIGTKCLLPSGIVWLDNVFTSSPESIQELTDSDVFFYSEKLIQRVYNLYLRDVKSNNEIKKSFLLFLDRMINAGSSLAFIVRERVISI